MAATTVMATTGKGAQRGKALARLWGQFLGLSAALIIGSVGVSLLVYRCVDPYVMGGCVAGCVLHALILLSVTRDGGES